MSGAVNVTAKLPTMDGVLDGVKGGVVKVGITRETPDRYVCQRHGQRVTTPLVMRDHVTVDIATTVHLIREILN